MGLSDDSRAIIEFVISMAHMLGIVTIAEGVETEMQHRLLMGMGCDGMQGFLFAKPMPGREASDVPKQLTGEVETAVVGF